MIGDLGSGGGTGGEARRMSLRIPRDRDRDMGEWDGRYVYGWARGGFIGDTR